MKLTSSGYPMERIATNILGPLPETEKRNRYILVISDYFTKWVVAFPIPDQRAETVAKCLVDGVISRFGVPSYIHSDQGRQFESELYEEVCFLLDIKNTRTTTYIHKVMEWLKGSTQLWRHYYVRLLTKNILTWMKGCHLFYGL